MPQRCWTWRRDSTPQDSYSRDLGRQALAGMRCGVPRRDQLQFFGDSGYERLFDQTLSRFEATFGIEPVAIDFAPFLEAARLLYDGPWIAERYAAIGEFLEAHPGALHPVTRRIIEAGKLPTASAAFRGQYKLQELKRQSESAWSPGGRHTHAHRRDDLLAARGRPGSTSPECQSWVLYELHEPVRSLRRRRARGLSRRRNALRRHPGGAASRGARAARAGGETASIVGCHRGSIRVARAGSRTAIAIAGKIANAFVAAAIAIAARGISEQRRSAPRLCRHGSLRCPYGGTAAQSSAARSCRLSPLYRTHGRSLSTVRAARRPAETSRINSRSRGWPSHRSGGLGTARRTGGVICRGYPRALGTGQSRTRYRRTGHGDLSARGMRPRARPISAAMAAGALT